MQYLALFFVALTAISSTSARPFDLVAREDCTPQFEQVKRNQSTSFGWQVSATAATSDALDEICSKFDEGDYSKWAQQGLDLAIIKAPICNSRTPDASLALSKIAQANTNVFSNLILNAFSPNNTTQYSYLCDNLRFVQLDGFLLNSALLINAACTAGNDSPKPEPFSSIASVNETAVHAYQNIGSKLYAYEYASAATTTEELTGYCSSASDAKSDLKALMLNGTLVEETLCSVQTPLTVADGIATIKALTSDMFIAVIENVSNTAGYLDWLCENLDEDAMESVGMCGPTVKTTVCADAAARKAS